MAAPRPARHLLFERFGLMQTRIAMASEVPILTRLINAAYVVERFFKIGDRITAEGVRALQGTGTFLLLENEGEAVGSVYVEVRGDRGYLGLLAVDPDRQGNGYGRALMNAAEEYFRQNGALHADLRVVNLREELPPFYRQLGYVECGTEPFSDPAEATRPCHFVVMTKPLGGRASEAR
jgi:GNAT superfamily N-acetyltransferase